MNQSDERITSTKKKNNINKPKNGIYPTETAMRKKRRMRRRRMPRLEILRDPLMFLNERDLGESGKPRLSLAV